MRRALAINEASFGAEHPKVSIYLNSLAVLLQATNRLTEAEPLMRRAVEIFARFRETTGYDHPSYAVVLENLEATRASGRTWKPSCWRRLFFGGR